jgi:hypothetical protein
MALISSTTIITSVSLLHLTLAYFFLSNPLTIDDQALVWVLGESMGMVGTPQTPAQHQNRTENAEYGKGKARRKADEIV